MSRLYGKSIEVSSLSKTLVDSNIPKYKRDNKRTTWEDVETCPEIIDLYLPDSAFEIIEKTPIKIVASPLVIKSASLLPQKGVNEEPTMFFPRMNPIEEYKRELVFFLGELLSTINPDEMPKENDIPCEYANVIGLLLEYLYLKENGIEDTFSLKHLNELLYNAKRYVKSHKNYRDILFSKKNSNLYLVDEEKESKIEENVKKVEQQFLDATLTNLIPLSSMDVVLQLADSDMNKNEIKELLDALIKNRDHNRQEIIHKMGIQTYGFKRLRKEIDWRR